ncbi:DUF1003 domain-containing protein [Micromonospora sp. H33]|uniref:DUF1003 domain-containing protein n=1 Tax=Micromonospora sp. H33 TaxID=3452215 RepID=UPI003F8B77F5
MLYRWDPYPFILLNLLFSTQAAYAAPLILLSQNRQADTDRVKAERDYQVNQLVLQYPIAWHRDTHSADCDCVRHAEPVVHDAHRARARLVMRHVRGHEAVGHALRTLDPSPGSARGVSGGSCHGPEPHKPSAGGDSGARLRRGQRRYGDRPAGHRGHAIGQRSPNATAGSRLRMEPVGCSAPTLGAAADEETQRPPRAPSAPGRTSVRSSYPEPTTSHS